MINRGWGETVAKSHLFRLGVADPIHLSGKAVMSAMGRQQKIVRQTVGVRSGAGSRPKRAEMPPAADGRRLSGIVRKACVRLPPQAGAPSEASFPLA